MTRAEEITHVIRDLVSKTPDVQSAAVVDHDGLMIASNLPQDADYDAVGATTATLLSLGERVTHELGRGNFKRLMIKGHEGYGIIVPCAAGAALCVTANRSAKLGIIFFDIQRCAETVARLLR